MKYTLEQHLKEYKEQYKQAQMQVVALQGAIQAVERLLQEDKDVVESKEEDVDDGK